MSHDRLDEIVRRLEDLERRVRGTPPPPPPPGPPSTGPGLPDEKRIVDLVVRLVTEHVEKIVERKLREMSAEIVDEKRLVDLVVRGVAERMEEMADRRERDTRRRADGRDKE